MATKAIPLFYLASMMPALFAVSGANSRPTWLYRPGWFLENQHEVLGD